MRETTRRATAGAGSTKLTGQGATAIMRRISSG
jgi:hypothetical protein